MQRLILKISLNKPFRPILGMWSQSNHFRRASNKDLIQPRLMNRLLNIKTALNPKMPFQATGLKCVWKEFKSITTHDCLKWVPVQTKRYYTVFIIYYSCHSNMRVCWQGSTRGNSLIDVTVCTQYFIVRVKYIVTLQCICTACPHNCLDKPLQAQTRNNIVTWPI